MREVEEEDNGRPDMEVSSLEDPLDPGRGRSSTRVLQVHKTTVMLLYT